MGYNLTWDDLFQKQGQSPSGCCVLTDTQPSSIYEDIIAVLSSHYGCVFFLQKPLRVYTNRAASYLPLYSPLSLPLTPSLSPSLTYPLSPHTHVHNIRNLAIGIGIQNFPEGLAVSLPLRAAGMGVWKSLW